MEIVAWVLAHKEILVGALVALLTLASLVTALTPSPKDDAVVAKIRSWVARLGFAQFEDSPGTAKWPGAKPSRPEPILRPRGEDEGRVSADAR